VITSFTAAKHTSSLANTVFIDISEACTGRRGFQKAEKGAGYICSFQSKELIKLSYQLVALTTPSR
jgi:hypothetical protein